MKIKTADAKDAALDWLVAKCAWEPERVFLYGEPVKHVRVANRPDIAHEYNLSIYYTPSTDWAQGGPIIERDGIELQCNTSALQAAAYKNANPDWFACLKFKRADHWHGTTPLIAAMRCYVASKLGDEVEIPEELT
jgi:hypothetical protein